MESSLCLSEEEKTNLSNAKQNVFEGYDAARDRFPTDDDYILYLRRKLTRAHELLKTVPST